MSLIKVIIIFYIFQRGYANGSMSLQSNSELLIFSTLSLKESIKDDYRYDYDYWDPWKISNR